MKKNADLLKHLKILSTTINNYIKLYDAAIQSGETDKVLSRLAKGKFKLAALKNEIQNLAERISNSNKEPIATTAELENTLNEIEKTLDNGLTIVFPRYPDEKNTLLAMAAKNLSDSIKNLRAALDPTLKLANDFKNLVPLTKINNQSIMGSALVQEAVTLLELSTPTLTGQLNKLLQNNEQISSPLTTTPPLPANANLYAMYTPPSLNDLSKTTKGKHPAFTLPPTIGKIDIPSVSTTFNIQAGESNRIIKPESAADKQWAEIRLKAIGSKWGKGEAWEHKKIGKEDRKTMSAEEINARVIAVSIDKLQHLLGTDKTKEKYTSRQNADSINSLDAKYNLYAGKSWASASKAEEKNVLTISQNNIAIFEVRPGENKIQFLIPNPTAEQRVAGFEMFQQMCRIKGNAAEVKINCNNPSIKAEFEKNATTAKIKPVSDFTNKPSM
jgi:hypothetical protein